MYRKTTDIAINALYKSISNLKLILSVAHQKWTMAKFDTDKFHIYCYCTAGIGKIELNFSFS